MRFGGLVENIKYYEDKPRTVNTDDVSITENTRLCYPIEHIPGAAIPCVGGHPKNIIFLTADANGVLPPVAQLTPEQAMYHFMSGYTAKVAGTEMGITDPVPSFSACFGEAFLPLHPYTYAKMLAEKCAEHHCKVWLVNTGWSGGKYGVGKRMSLKVTRRIIDGIHSGDFDASKCEFEVLDGFNLSVPKSCSGIDSKILNPVNTWLDKAAYNVQLNKLIAQFKRNFDKYADGTPDEVLEKGGPTAI
jgi:phosphoenolpyruvate carboxykinase (ATP)